MTPATSTANSPCIDCIRNIAHSDYDGIRVLLSTSRLHDVQQMLCDPQCPCEIPPGAYC